MQWNSFPEYYKWIVICLPIPIMGVLYDVIKFKNDSWTYQFLFRKKYKYFAFTAQTFNSHTDFSDLTGIPFYQSMASPSIANRPRLGSAGERPRSATGPQANECKELEKYVKYLFYKIMSIVSKECKHYESNEY